MLAVLTVVVTIAINTFGGNTRDVQVPDVRGQVSADAIAALQNHGFKTRTQQKPDSTVPPDHVIGTDPGANASVGAGDEITINVSTGPEQREMPDVSSLSYADAVKKLKRRRLRHGSSRAHSPSTPELKDRVIGTNPPANQTSAITNEITIIVGSGPESQAGSRRRGPDRRLGAAEPDRRTASPRSVQVAGRQHPRRPAQVIGTNPPAGQTVPVDTVIQIAGVAGQPVHRCRTCRGSSGPTPSRGCGRWAGPAVLDKGADVARQRLSSTNAVVTQSPSAGQRGQLRRARSR